MTEGFAYLFVGTLVTLAVEWIRSVATGIDGRLVNLTAWLVGVAATFIPPELVAQFQFDGLDIENRLLAGLILAGLSSLIAEAKGALNNSRKLNAEALKNAGEGDEVFGSEGRFDEGYNPGDPGYNPVTGTFDPALQPPPRP